MPLGAKGGYTKKIKSVGFIQQMICCWPKTRGDEKESHEKCPSSKGTVQFLWSSSKIISQLTSAPSCDDASSRREQNSKSSKASELWTRHLHHGNLCKCCDHWLKPVNAKQKNTKNNGSLPVWRRLARWSASPAPRSGGCSARTPRKSWCTSRRKSWKQRAISTAKYFIKLEFLLEFLPAASCTRDPRRRAGTGAQTVLQTTFDLKKKCIL